MNKYRAELGRSPWVDGQQSSYFNHAANDLYKRCYQKFSLNGAKSLSNSINVNFDKFYCAFCQSVAKQLGRSYTEVNTFLNQTPLTHPYIRQCYQYFYESLPGLPYNHGRLIDLIKRHKCYW